MSTSRLVAASALAALTAAGCRSDVGW